jgi:TetR/AcrR family transcriptional regulator, repressor for uid operon
MSRVEVEPERTAADGTFLERVLSGGAGPLAEDPSTTRILDAAYEQFCMVGIQRTTMEDVAKRAGVSRITVYRRIATKDALVDHVLRREFDRYVAQFLADVRAAETAADRVVLGFASALRAIRRNPLLSRLLVVEPEALVRSLIGDGGRTLELLRSFVAGQLRAEQRAGHVGDDVDVDLVAELMVRVSASFLLTPSRIVDLDDDAHVEALARQFLAPMLER